jgi:Uma2 family endonuclease
MQQSALAEKAAGLYTWDDFIALDDGDRRELIDGDLLEIDVPPLQHAHISALLIFFLTGWARSGNASRVLASGYKVRITSRRGVMPDVQLYRRGNLPVKQSKGLEKGRPDLAVEVISPSSRGFDRVKKLRWYASIGVPEYWIVDPEAHTLERLVLDGKRYVIEESLSDDDVFEPASFEGLRVPLAELWEAPEND